MIIDFDGEIATARADMAKAHAAIATIGDDLTRRTSESAISNLDAEIKRWATTYRAKVEANTWTAKRWVDYGNELIAGAERYVRDAGDLSTQFSRLANTVGDFGQWVESQWTKVVDQIANLSKDFDRLGRERAILEKQRVAFKNAPLNARAKELLYGKSSDEALVGYERLRTLVQGLNTVVSLVGNGRAKLAPAANGDVTVVPTSTVGSATLGVVPALAAGTVIATVAIAVGLAASITSYFRTKNTELEQETKRLELDLIKQGRGAEVAAWKKLDVEAQKTKPDDPFSALMKLGKVLVIAVGVVAAVVGVKLVVDAVRGSRRATS